jgi:hypothetical protein
MVSAFYKRFYVNKGCILGCKRLSEGLTNDKDFPILSLPRSAQIGGFSCIGSVFHAIGHFLAVDQFLARPVATALGAHLLFNVAGTPSVQVVDLHLHFGTLRCR